VDPTLVDRARAGDARAFEELATSLERALFRHVARLLGPDDAEDAVQDAFLSAWRSMRSFEGTSFRAWLFRIATNRALDVIRARKRRGELPLEPAEDEERTWTEPPSPGPSLDRLVAGAEARALVEAALRTIPTEQRAALLLRDVEGFDYEEIAGITAAELGTVKSRIHRARLAVRNALVAQGWKSAAG